MSPEVVTGRLYGKGCDVWGAGVMLHVLLSGRLPFLGSGIRLQQSIARGRLSVSSIRSMNGNRYNQPSHPTELHPFTYLVKTSQNK